jgi:hypothetical protein
MTKAVRYDEFGGIDVLRIDEVDRPVPAASCSRPLGSAPSADRSSRRRPAPTGTGYGSPTSSKAGTTS